MRSNLVYLAGPITGQSYEGATSWRDWFTDRINQRFSDVNCISPMRGKYYLESSRDIQATGNELLGILSGGPAIVARDYSDTMNADILVVNLIGASRISIGTMFEIAWAYTKHIPVILVIEDGNENVHTHSMLFAMCGYRVNNLDDALNIVSAFFASSNYPQKWDLEQQEAHAVSR